MTFRLELRCPCCGRRRFLLACVAILLVAIARWQRHSRVSLLASAGALLLLLRAGIALFWDLLYVRNPEVAGGLDAAERLVAWTVLFCKQQAWSF